jgi:2,4-dienoyl-CoA reductase-like NADH-dependent reductase (Old Yellow Enzyme family)
MFNVPGIWTSEQVEAWKPIVANVKKTGAVFIAQRERHHPPQIASERHC